MSKGNPQHNGEFDETTPAGRKPLEVLVSVESELETLNDNLLEVKELLDRDGKRVNGQLGAIASGLSQIGSVGGKEGLQTNQNEYKQYTDHDLNRGEACALMSVHETKGNPTTSEANDEYLNYGFGPTKGTGAAIAARLTELKEKRLVDRTPNQPYRYWVTDKGKEAVDQLEGELND